ncbi:unnamed protein product (macronuclear) [Paramecium tetraurelia]|uniref:Aminotransferase class I/classII large domain-containing protein n=1 Tax=Paramecium tetraurelia TaxID=5888 RepID=A0C047_PARTE|nr:uncharacterized protein GSPATT00006017001 [Paramecium tetraurelia]CAK64164.1 unnamed protein product [Paramecium tetraurelia]|eukprot:XP_001431562.1 hypothetical protein (macronuclear) [Paramecium tetraurelia strain d4-2]
MNYVSNRMLNYLEPQMYARFTILANQKGCINLGQGFPNFPPPQFLREALSQEALTEQLQYTQTAGHPKLLNSAAYFLEQRMGLKINIDKEIVVSSGAQSVLCCLMQGILNPNDEPLVFLQKKQQICIDLLIEFSGGKHIGVPIKPKVFNTKENGQFIYSDEDKWELDFVQLEQSINQKTKLIILNSPMNPIGKYIFTFIIEYFNKDEYDKLAEILEKHPNIIVCEDAAYHHITFGNNQPFIYPRCITHPKLKDKSICVMSAGKMFSATGLRVGFAIGNENIIKGMKAAQTYHIFCLNPVNQTATARCLDQTADGIYFDSIRHLYEQQATKLLKGLVESRLNLNYWVPSGGYFIVTDISNVEIPNKYFTQNDVKVTRDFAFAHYLINEFGVVCIPCSPYYENKETGQNLVRWAFCKTDETISEAINRLK